MRGGRKLDRDTEALINYAGFVFLVLLTIWLFTRDLDRLAITFFGKGIGEEPM